MLPGNFFLKSRSLSVLLVASIFLAILVAPKNVSSCSKLHCVPINSVQLFNVSVTVPNTTTMIEITLTCRFPDLFTSRLSFLYFSNFCSWVSPSVTISIT